jgi:hypothetical protein
MNRLVLAASVALLVAGCLKSNSVSCTDGRVCPTGSACDDIHHICVLPDQLTSCNGASDGTPCAVAGRDAVCNRGICVEPFCGDGLVSGDEQCDPATSAGDCKSIGYYEQGALGCNSDCTVDASACSGGRCGDAVVQPMFELCDVTPPAGVSCFDYGFDMGRLTCNSFCNFDFGTCSHVGWYSERQPDLGLFAYGVGGTSRNDVFVVAWTGKILHYDGVVWTEQASPLAGFNVAGQLGYLFAVSAAAPNDVYAVGSFGTIIHYDGASWSTISAPDVSAPTLWGVWANTSNDVFAVGNGGTIRHFDGTSWSTTTTGADLFAVWGRAGNDVYAAGAGRSALHFNGSAWSPMSFDSAVGASLTIRSLWGTTSAVYAAGSTSAQAGQILKLDNGTWNLMTSVAAAPRTIWASADDDIYAGSPIGVQHFDGIRWETQDTTDVTTIWGSGPTDIIAAGGSKIRRRGALAWVKDTVGRTRAVSGTAPDDVFAFGAVASHWDGTSWTSIASPPPAGFDVWAAPTGEVFGVSHGSTGDLGPLARWTPGTPSWTALSSSTLRLRSVWGSSATDVYAVGGTLRGVDPTSAGTASIVHFDGTSSQVVESRPGDAFHAVWGTGPSDVFVTSYRGQILHFDGSTWAEQRAPAAVFAPLKTIWGSAPDDVYAAGQGLGSVGSMILHYDGSTWSPQSPGLDANIDHLAGWGPYDLYATTKANGVILHSDGAQWVPLRLREETAPIFHGAWAAPFAAGAHSTRMFFVGYSFDADDRIYRLERSCDTREQLCSDREDDDCDGLVDCLDADCASSPECAAGGLCRPATQLVCESSIAGDTRKGAWRIDSYRGGQRPEVGPEVAYSFTAATSGSVTVSLTGFTGDLDLLVIPAAPAGGCAPTDDAIQISSTTNATEKATFTTIAGATYYIVVDGYDGAYSTFQLDVACM